MGFTLQNEALSVDGIPTYRLILQALRDIVLVSCNGVMAKSVSVLPEQQAGDDRMYGLFSSYYL